MKLDHSNSLYLLLLVLISNWLRLAEAQVTTTDLSSHFVTHPNNLDLKTLLPDLELRNPESFYEGETQVISTIDLTREEAENLNTTLRNLPGNIKGWVESNGEFTITDPDHTDVISDAGSNDNPYLKELVRCSNVPAKKVAIVIDSKLDFGNPYFNGSFVGTNIVNGPNYSVYAPGSTTHGMRVAWIMSQVVRFTSPADYIYGIEVFNGQGKASFGSVITAFRHATQKGAALKENGYEVMINFSGEGPYFNSLNLVVSDALKKGLHVTVANGNKRQPCSEVSPASTPGVEAVCATYMGDQAADFTSYGCSAKPICAPGYISTPNFINGRVSTFTGTSGSSPFAGALKLAWAATYRGQTTAQLDANFRTVTTPVMPQAGSQVVGPMYLIYEDLACPENANLFNSSYRTTVSTRNKFTNWYSGVTNGDFNIQFAVRSLGGIPLLGLQNIGDLRMGAWNNRQRCENYVFTFGGVKYSNCRRANLVNQKQAGHWQLAANETDNTVKLFYLSGGNPRLILTGFTNKTLTHVAFSSTRGDVIYPYARKLM